jgi:hypothetical protein
MKIHVNQEQQGQHWIYRTVPVFFTCWSCAKVAATVGHSRHNDEEEEEDWDKEKCDNGYRNGFTIFLNFRSYSIKSSIDRAPSLPCSLSDTYQQSLGLFSAVHYTYVNGPSLFDMGQVF